MKDIYPLSPMQKGLLFHSLYAPHQDVYFRQTTCRFTGSLDICAFQKAWQAVIDRHDILRTYFVWEGVSEPVQVVCSQIKAPWVQYDWRGIAADEQDQRFRKFLLEDSCRGFDLGQEIGRAHV